MATLRLSKREKLGTRPSHRLRQGGQVPAVVYGHGQPNESVVLDQHEIEKVVKHGERLLHAEVEGQEQHFLLKDVQLDYLGQRVLHVDLLRVNLDENVQVTVPIRLRGTPVGVEAESGVLTQHLPKAVIECVVTNIPEELRVNVAGLHVNDSLRVKNLELPEGVKVLADPERLVASVAFMAEEVVAAAAAPAEGAAAAAGEPEVIGAKKEEEAEGGEEEKPAKKEKKE